jgi:hypothetical protein
MAASKGGLFLNFSQVCDVCFWHLADNPAAAAFVRYWTKADNGRLWPGSELSAFDP